MVAVDYDDTRRLRNGWWWSSGEIEEHGQNNNVRKAIEGWTVKAANIRSAASLSWPCNTQHTVRYTKLSPARFKDFWGYIASIVGRVKISILLWRYG